jgi:hypothetical protein
MQREISRNELGSELLLAANGSNGCCQPEADILVEIDNLPSTEMVWSDGEERRIKHGK